MISIQRLFHGDIQSGTVNPPPTQMISTPLLTSGSFAAVQYLRIIMEAGIFGLFEEFPLFPKAILLDPFGVA